MDRTLIAFGQILALVQIRYNGEGVELLRDQVEVVLEQAGVHVEASLAALEWLRRTSQVSIEMREVPCLRAQPPPRRSNMRPGICSSEAIRQSWVPRNVVGHELMLQTGGSSSVSAVGG